MNKLRYYFFYPFDCPRHVGIAFCNAKFPSHFFSISNGCHKSILGGPMGLDSINGS